MPRSTDLTRNQLEIIADQLAPMLDYFRLLEERMDEQGNADKILTDIAETWVNAQAARS